MIVHPPDAHRAFTGGRDNREWDDGAVRFEIPKIDPRIGGGPKLHLLHALSPDHKLIERGRLREDQIHPKTRHPKMSGPFWGVADDRPVPVLVDSRSSLFIQIGRIDFLSGDMAVVPLAHNGIVVDP